MTLPKRVLVIDDDEDDRDIFLEVVSEFGMITAETAINGADGLHKLHSASALPDLIFLDLNMPVMNGPEFLQKFMGVANLRTIPVVILSTSSDEWAIKEARSLGATDFIRKPDKISEWRNVLKPFFA